MVGIFRYLFHRYRIEAELLDYELDFPTIRKKRKKILKNKLENYLKIPVIKAEPEDLLRGLPNPTNDIDILFIPDYIGKNKLNKKLLSKFPIQLFQDLEEEDLSNKEIFLIKKERYLKLALKNEKIGNLEIASNFYEKAAFMADKLSEFLESKLYLKKAEEITKSISKKSKMTSRSIKNIYSKFKIKDINNHVQIPWVDKNKLEDFKRELRKLDDI